jgi:N-acetylglucosamine-6-sulfatase
MRRTRTSLVMVAALALTLPPVTSSVGSAGLASAAESQPNIVIILSDDERLGLTDAMPTVRRRIQQMGVTYSNYMVPTALCCPSRASLLTGKFPHGTHVWGNDLPGDPALSGGQAAFAHFGNESQTLAAVLDTAGYQTAMVGKYLNGYVETDPVPQGWDEFKAFTPKSAYYNYTLGGVAYGSAPEDYSTDVVAEHAVEFIQSSGSDPLFLYVAPYGPHSPYTPAPRHAAAEVSEYVHARDFGALNEKNLSDKPEWLQAIKVRDEDKVRRVARLQHRAVMSVDDLTADVLDALKAKGIISNTLIVYASDNGQLWGEHRYVGKNVPYWRATEVPLYVRWDDRLPAGTKDSRLGLNVDLTATIAEAADVAMPWSEGRSLVSGSGRLGFVLESIGSYPPFRERPAYCGWRSQNRLYVRYATGEEELYLYPKDRFERTSLHDVRRYRETLRSMRANARAQCVPTPPDFTWTP